MSGGRFSYDQYKIGQIADEIEQEVINSGKPIPENKLDSWQREHPEEAVNAEWPESVLRKMEEAIYALRKAAIFAQRIDYLLCCDDGIETFFKRLDKELKELDEKAARGENGLLYIPVDRTMTTNEENS